MRSPGVAQVSPNATDAHQVQPAVAPRPRGLVFTLATGEVRGRALLALGLDHPLRDQLADREGQVLGRRAELLVDLLDAQTGIRLDKRGELAGQRLEIGRGALGAPPAAGAAHLAGSSATGAARALATERGLQRVESGPTSKLGDLRHEALHGAIHISLEVVHSRPHFEVQIEIT